MEVTKPIKVGNVWTNLISGATGESVNFEEVTTWWDGTPMDDSKADGYIYRKLPDTNGGGYVRRALGNYGQVLQKDTVSGLRDLSTTEALLLKMGYYSHVQLNGYYVKGDTPGPIDYKLSESGTSDNGGSLFEVQDIKLEHSFLSRVDIRYFGAVGDGEEDDTIPLQSAITYISNKTLILPPGIYRFTTQLTIPANKQIVIKGEGRRGKSGGATSSSSGMVVLRYDGEFSDTAILMPGVQDGNRPAAVLKTFSLVNDSGRTDVDGIVCSYCTGTTFFEVEVRRFRDNMVIDGYFFYNAITNCNFTNAIRHGVYSRNSVLFNGTEFSGCRFNLSGGWGLWSDSGMGEIVTLRGCTFEGNEEGGVCIKRALVSNIENNYFEFNGGNNIQIHNRPTVSGSGVNNIVANISGNKFRSGDDVHIIHPYGYSDDYTITLNVFGNVVEGYDISADNTTTHFIQSAVGTSTVLINMQANVMVQGADSGRVLFSNRKSFAFFRGVSVGSDQFMESLTDDTPDNVNTYLNIAGEIRAIRNQYTDLDGGTTNFDIRFPGKAESNINFRIGQGDVTSGSHTTTFYSGTSARARVDHNLGTVEAATGVCTTAASKRGVYFGVGNPEGEITAPENSLFLSSSGVFKKVSGTGNTGWVLMQTATSPDTASPVGAAYSQSEVQAILTELRDLKTKMRAAGLLAT